MRRWKNLPRARDHAPVLRHGLRRHRLLRVARIVQRQQVDVDPAVGVGDVKARPVDYREPREEISIAIQGGSVRAAIDGVRMQPGDVVVFSKEEKHWHGATNTTGMTHIAVNLAGSQLLSKGRALLPRVAAMLTALRSWTAQKEAFEHAFYSSMIPVR